MVVNNTAKINLHIVAKSHRFSSSLDNYECLKKIKNKQSNNNKKDLYYTESSRTDSTKEKKTIMPKMILTKSYNNKFIKIGKEVYHKRNNTTKDIKIELKNFFPIPKLNKGKIVMVRRYKSILS